MLSQPNFIPQLRLAGSLRWVLYLPFISIAAVLTEIAFQIIVGSNPFSAINVDINKLFINIFLLNSLHLIFPFIVLLVLPYGRAFVRTKKNLWRKNWITGLLVIIFIALLFGVSLNSTKHLDFLGFLQPLIAGCMIWIWYLVPTFHGMRQSAGLSQLLGSIEFTADPKYLRARKLEKILLRFYYFGVMCTFVLQKWWAASDPEVIWMMSALSIILAVAIIANAKKTNASGTGDKYLFSYRFLLWPLQPYSQVVLWSVIFNHGFEYIALISHMLKISIEKNSTRKIFIATALFGMALISVYNVFDYFYPEYPSWVSDSWTFSVFLALYPFLTLLHYAIDGTAYRMSDPDVQKTIGQFFVATKHSG